MSRIVTIVLLVLVIAFSYFAYYNQNDVTLVLWRGQVSEFPLIGIVLIAMGIGATFILILFGIRGIRRTFVQVQERMKRRRREKAEELYNKGVDAHLSGKEEKAVKFLEDAVGKDSDFLLPFFRLGKVYLGEGKADQAIALHQKARVAHPKDLRLLLMLVDDFIAAEKFQDAAAVLKEIIGRDDGNRTALTLLRDIQEREADWSGAVDTQRKLLKISGKAEETQVYLTGLKYQLATGLVKEGEYDKAVKLLKEVLKEAPDFVPATVSQGEAFIAMGKQDEGLKALIEGYRSLKNPVFLQVIEDKLLEQENPAKLIEIYQELLEKMPDDVFLNLFYGKTCLRLEMVDQGLMALKKVESFRYDSPFLHALLGEAKAKRERFEDAVEEFRKYMEISLGMSPQYQCGHCGYTTRKWSARCESCSRWNTLTLPALDKVSALPAAAPRYESQEA
ncbi:MAG TPA: DUF1049 domain-containing protein [Proteobacteria bacterium]|nr:tetratricopeptide repeat protein [bacterium BMS3Abin14]HDL52904.1 DUF1049 domain-containing protein [Pseudomonadota bacterium]